MEPGVEEGEGTKVTHGVEMGEDQEVAKKDWENGESSLLMGASLLNKSLLRESVSLIGRQRLGGWHRQIRRQDAKPCCKVHTRTSTA